MKTQNFLVINAGWEQEPLLKKLKELGHNIFAVHHDDMSASSWCDKTLKCSVTDITTIKAFALSNQIDAIISDQCDYSLVTQAYLADYLELPGPGLQASLRATHKQIQRDFCKAHDILIPNYQLCTSLEEAKHFTKVHGFPIVIKPVDNRGSIGVSVVSTPSELRGAYYHAAENSNSRLTLIEEFIEGLEVTVDGYCFNGEPKSLAAASKQHLKNSQHPVAMDIHYPPKNVSDQRLKDLLKHNEWVNKTLGFRFGMTHSEYIVTPEGQFYLVETTNRGGGVFTSEIIVPFVSQIDLLSVYIHDCLGLTDTSLSLKQSTEQTHQALLKFFSLPEGTVTSISGTSQIIENPHTLAFRLQITPGEVISTITSDAHRHGFVILGSAEREDNLHQISEDILKELQVNYAT